MARRRSLRSVVTGRGYYSSSGSRRPPRGADGRSSACPGGARAPYERDWKEAERRFCLAMAREPVPWHVRQWHAYFCLFPVGRFEEALVSIS
jgi:hypothetical protein